MPGHSSACSYAPRYSFTKAVYARIASACRSTARFALTCLGETHAQRESDDWSDGVERGVYLGMLLGLMHGYEQGVQDERSRATADAQRQRLAEMVLNRQRADKPT